MGDIVERSLVLGLVASEEARERLMVRLRTARGDYLDIGGSTGGGSRRIIDTWQPPDWRDFLQDERER